jgi:hypothetical protein
MADSEEELRHSGGIDSVAAELLSHVDPGVKALQRTKLTRQALDTTRLGQSRTWPARIGYLDYLTDS